VYKIFTLKLEAVAAKKLPKVEDFSVASHGFSVAVDHQCHHNKHRDLARVEV